MQVKKNLIKKKKGFRKLAYLNLGTKYNHGKKRINQLKTQRKASWFDVSFCHIPLPISQTTSNSTTTKKTVVKAIDGIL